MEMSFTEALKELMRLNEITIYFYPASDRKTLTGDFVRLSDNHSLLKWMVDTENDDSTGMTYVYLFDLFIDKLAKAKQTEDVFKKLSYAISVNKEEKGEVSDLSKEDFTVREQTLNEAKKCILGDREQDYGSPEDNFTTIAKFWSDYLDKDISAQQVADMMILMKVSRIKNGGGTGDSYVDIAGYAACGNELLSKTHK